MKGSNDENILIRIEEKVEYLIGRSPLATIRLAGDLNISE